MKSKFVKQVIRIVCFCSFLLFAVQLEAQFNLVPNGSFEEHTGCPTHVNQLDLCMFWLNPTHTSPDYFNRCAYQTQVGIPENAFGVQEAHSGDAYTGLVTYCGPDIYPSSWEYIEVPLKTALEAHTYYHFSMFVNLADNARYSSSDVGVYFSDTIISDVSWYCPLPFIPQISNSSVVSVDTLNWTLLEGDIIASGGEKYIIIGNFKDNLSTSVTISNPYAIFSIVYLFIDDVSLYKSNTPIYTANAGADQVICRNEGVTLQMQYFEDFQYRWFTLDSVLIDTTCSITVNPDTTTQYVLWIRDFKYDESWDTITVSVTDDCGGSVYIPNIFSPNNDNQNDKLFVRGENIESLHFLIYNRWGNRVFETTDASQGWDGTQNGRPCETGVYVYRAEVTFKNGQKEIKKGDVALVR